MELIFATNNRNKVQEVQSLLPHSLHLITLAEAGIDIDIPEPFETLQENASIKIETILRISQKNAGFSEDSGLFIPALDGRPGVHSAHYAGPQRRDADNIQRVLAELQGVTDRSAYFQTTICLIWEGKSYFFTGTCPGTITESPKGDGGFGYDPIFCPSGAPCTFGEMSLTEKNEYSHRKKAVAQLIAFLQEVGKNI
jgi:XTP/dITP diphosphohydrolase